MAPKTCKTNDFKRNYCIEKDTATQDFELEIPIHCVMLNDVIPVFITYDTIIILHTYVCTLNMPNEIMTLINCSLFSALMKCSGCPTVSNKQDCMKILILH
jgi:hypothetical protein